MTMMIRQKARTHKISISVLLLVASIAPLARAEPCVLCPGGQPTPLLDKQVNIDWPVQVQSCAELDSYANSLEADSEDCAKIQSISTLCGCPKKTLACELCPGTFSNIKTPDKKLTFLASEFDGVAPSCALFEAFLHSFFPGDVRCFEAQLLSSACGCPVLENSCDLCQGDDISFDKTLPQIQQDLDDFWVWNLTATCGLDQAIVRNVEAGTEDCQWHQLRGHWCGCKESEIVRRLRTLVWMPRVSAILSFLGSIFIVFDITKKRNKTAQHQLLLCLSTVDCISSIAWAMSSLPVPEYDEDGYHNFVYGAGGTEATCKAQAFFIQLGFASPFYNVALAFYYTMIIIYQWNEQQIARYRWLLMGAPLLGGLTLACAGIPFYGPSVIMCYIQDEEVWFLVVPISIVIVTATLLMVRIFLKVYLQEQRVRQYSTTSHHLSRRVFWQGFWYLMCFYVSWPVVIAWVFIDETLYHRYYFMCVATFLAPLQGFLNFLSYSRLRFIKFCRSCCTFRSKHESTAVANKCPRAVVSSSAPSGGAESPMESSNERQGTDCTATEVASASIPILDSQEGMPTSSKDNVLELKRVEGTSQDGR
jgi:hypothetical protein